MKFLSSCLRSSLSWERLMMSVQKRKTCIKMKLFCLLLSFIKAAKYIKVFYSTSITLKTRSQKRSFSTESYFLEAGTGISLGLKQNCMKNESNGKCLNRRPTVIAFYYIVQARKMKTVRWQVNYWIICTVFSTHTPKIGSIQKWSTALLYDECLTLANLIFKN